MASAKKITQATAESEMEEGEIVDDLDDLSDVSSEEEFLLRQRLEVLEDYNNALERTKKKRTSGMIKPMQNYLSDRSKISAIDDIKLKNSLHTGKVTKHLKQHGKTKRRKETVQKVDVVYSKRKRDHRKKSNYTKNKPKLKIIRESSDESEDEYRNKRRKLADAVVGYRGKSDTSSLSARLKKMLHKSEDIPTETDVLNLYQNNNNQRNNLEMQSTPPIINSLDEVDGGKLKKISLQEREEEKRILEPIDLLSSDDDDVKVITNDNEHLVHIENGVQPNSINPEPGHDIETNSDEDLAQLRQQVLSTKSLKAKPQEAEPETKVPSEDEDSDTAELRLICLKSTLLKRAIEMKRKKKLQKRLSQTTLEDDIFNNEILFSSKIESDNNTDIESMDMDIGSDADERHKDTKDEIVRFRKSEADIRQCENNMSAINVTNKEEELEEDEDLLRAKLLTSLSKNLPNLVSPELLNNIDKFQDVKTTVKDAKAAKLPKEKRFIIKLDESDSSEGEHEATKNLTKMHMKLSEQTDFQQQLDLFLKSTRMQVENAKLPDVVQKQATPKKPEKFVAKAVTHLPKSEQIEYKNLVKRMAELVKMKELRQASINSATQPLKETLKPSNATINTSLEERISLSRKKIADESAKMLKLKEEATKLSQRYKIVSTELHNISTAITLNKKQQRAVHNCLSKIRHQHQTLIKSSPTSLHSKVNGQFNSFTSTATTVKLQKENTPKADIPHVAKDEYKNVIAQKTVKISIANDFNRNNTNIPNTRLCVEVNVANNKKVVKMPNPVMEKRLVEITKSIEKEVTDNSTLAKECCDILNTVEENTQEIINDCEIQRYIANDYKSPLDALRETSWKLDPNAILCPFDMAGQCKDPDCNYSHALSQQ